MSKVGGYIIVDLGPGPINAKTGSSVPVTIDGGNAEISGFAFHILAADVHIHHCGIVIISVTGDTQITVTVT